jgi:hypothetical protein
MAVRLSAIDENYNFSEDSRTPGQDVKPGRPEYEAGMLRARLRRSFARYKRSFLVQYCTYKPLCQYATVLWC